LRRQAIFPAPEKCTKCLISSPQVLYGNIGLSIHPQRKDQVSKDMLSWFPLFFPFKVRAVVYAPLYFSLRRPKEPLYLPSNSELQVSIWRLTNDRRVWYEWHAESFILLPTTLRAGEELLLGSPGFSTVPSFNSLGAPSPLIDSKELDTSKMSTPDFRHTDGELEAVKIGHTSLHNPGGRSSWIGL